MFGETKMLKSQGDSSFQNKILKDKTLHCGFTRVFLLHIFFREIETFVGVSFHWNFLYKHNIVCSIFQQRNKTFW